MRIKRNWWKGFFNEIYLAADARSVCNATLTRQEVDLIEEALDLDKDARILDMCGGHGRHSLELARRGFRYLTVLDFSNCLIKLGRKTTKEAGLDVKFICRDARFTRLKAGGFCAIFIMGNSFGYFPHERGNIRILREAHRLLKRGGKLLLDLAEPDYVRKNLKPLTWHEADKDIIVCRKRQLQGDIVKAREIVVSKSRGLLRDGCYCERIYDKDKIARLLSIAGFENLSIKRNISLHGKGEDYGLLTSRMIVTAAKP